MEQFQVADIARYLETVKEILETPTLPSEDELSKRVRVPCEATVNIGVEFSATFVEYAKKADEEVFLDHGIMKRLKEHYLRIGRVIKIDKSEQWILQNYFRAEMDDRDKTDTRMLFKAGQDALIDLTEVRNAVDEAGKDVPSNAIETVKNIWTRFKETFDKYPARAGI